MAAAAILLLFISVRLERPFWALGLRAAGMALFAAGAYWLAALGLLVSARRHRGDSSTLGAAVCLAAAVVVLAAGAALGASLPRTLVLWAPLLGLALLIGGQLLRRRISWSLILALIVSAGAGLMILREIPGWLQAWRLAREKPEISTSRIRTSLYDLEVTSFRHYTPRTPRSQGGLTLFADRYLLANGSGDLFVFQPSADLRSLDVEAIPYKVPINSAEFAGAAGTAVNANLFRVADVLAEERAGLHRIFVSHHYWKAKQRCWVMRVSSLEGRYEDFFSRNSAMTWKTVFETSPCIPLAEANAPPRFNGMESGGRMAWLTTGQLLLTVGDHGMDGYVTTVQAAQEVTYSYGKIILIDTDDLSSRLYSLGHRNPQGLTVSAEGRVWSTEHGPEGGDELNLIEEGGNYGWPLASYGTEYGSHSWPLAAKPGSHSGFLRPFYAWVPSIGVSGVLEVTSERFGYWQNDLIVYSLRGESFWRLRIRDGRVVLAAYIHFGERLREVIQGHHGELVVWSDERNIHFIAPAAAGRAESGESIYRVCAACHVAPAGGAAIGPSLSGVVGRAIASERDFAYSPALGALRGNWTKERLDEFLTDTSAYAPGTSMAFAGIPDAASRKALIDYLVSPESRLDVAPPKPEW